VKRFLTGCCVLLVALGAAGPAVASPQFKSSFKLKLTTQKSGASTGWTADAKLSDPGDPMKRPKILTGLKISFPPGSRFDGRAHAACSLTSKQLMDPSTGPESLCPKASHYGSGQAKVIVASTPLSFPIRSYNLLPLDFNKKKPELLVSVVLDPNNPDLSFLIDAPLAKGSVFFSLELAPQFDIHVTNIHFKVPASHRGKHDFLQTPKKCPRSKHWTAKVSATYVDKSKETRAISLPCRTR
jgi:hypothetical protein